MKKIYILTGIIVGIIIIVSGWLMFSDRFEQPIFRKEIKTPQENIKKEEVVLIIDSDEGDLKTFKITFNEGMTAFDVLEGKTGELRLDLKTNSFDIGIMVEAIGDKENGQDGKYWLYYINGEMPMVAADKQEIEPGDKIEFKFEKSPF